MPDTSSIERNAMHAVLEPQPTRRAKVAFLTHMIAPYRIPIFERLGEAFEMDVLYSNFEANRSRWEHLPSRIARCRVRQSWGVYIPFRQRTQTAAIYEERYLHMNPGFFTDLLRGRPDAIISTEMGFRTLTAGLYAKLARRPLWISCEDTHHTQRNTCRWKVRVRRWLARRNVRWISYGETSTRYVTSLGVPRERILQVQNCPDESLFSPEGPARFSVRPRPVVLSVGRLVALKGFDTLFRAAAKVQAAGHTFSLLIVGEGPEEANLRRLAAELKLQHVHFVPNQPPEVMAEVYRSGDVFVFPTLQDVWGLAVSEAMWCGLPVVCSIFAGCAEDVIPPADRFDPTNPVQFAEVLTRVISGKIRPPDCSCLWTCRDVADAIAADVRQVLADGCMEFKWPHCQLATTRHVTTSGLLE